MLSNYACMHSCDGCVQDIPVVVVFKAMGMESDQEIVQWVGKSSVYPTGFLLGSFFRIRLKDGAHL